MQLSDFVTKIRGLAGNPGMNKQQRIYTPILPRNKTASLHVVIGNRAFGRHGHM